MDFECLTETASSATVHAVELAQRPMIATMKSADVAGFGFRFYSSFDGLLESADPSSIGCILVHGAADSIRNDAMIVRLNVVYPAMPIIVFQEVDSTALTVSFMRQGAYSVIVRHGDPEDAISVLTAAVELSRRRQATLNTASDASRRMTAATRKEREVLDLILAGRKNKDISADLNITVRAVEDRRFRLMKKLGVNSLAELIATAVHARYHDEGLAHNQT